MVWAGRQSLQRFAKRRSACGSQGTVSLRSRTTASLRGFRSLLARPQSTTPEGESRHRAGDTPGQMEDQIMAKKPAQTAANTRRRNDQERKPITLEMVLAICPHARLAENLSTTFGLDPVDTAGIREATEEHVAQTGGGTGSSAWPSFAVLCSKHTNLYVQKYACSPASIGVTVP